MLARDEDILKAAEDWRKAGKDVALATVVETWGSAPRPVGSNLVIDGEGNFLGSVSGGCVEAALRSGKSGMVETPQGQVFLTVYVPPPRLVITGAVHISQALAPMAKLVGYDVVIVDPRTAFATPERFPDVKVIAEWPDTALPPLNIDGYTAFVALTHDPKIDDPALTHALERDCFYIGALGSRKTHARRVERLKQQGIGDDAIARIHAPIGLSIGSVSPAEIAVAIIGESTHQLRGPKEV